jgi:hypothetical protein
MDACNLGALGTPDNVSLSLFLSLTGSTLRTLVLPGVGCVLELRGTSCVFAGSGQGACRVSVLDLSIDAVPVSRELSVVFADGHVFMSVSITFTLQWYFIYEVLWVGNIKIVLWDVTPCSFNRMLPIYQTKRRHIPQ